MAFFSERFKELIETSKMEYADISNMLNVSRYQLYNWCSGRGEPDTETLKAIAKNFDVSLDWLLGESNVRKPVFDHPDKHLPPEAIEMLNAYREFLNTKFIKQ